GDFLAQIDPRPFQAALTQAEGTLRRDQAQLADAQLDLKRYEELVKEDSIAQQQLDTQRALVKQYTGTIEADQGAVSTARVNLGFTHIVSPANGRVGLRQVDQGNYVTPGDTNGIVVVTQLQPITVIFSVPEDYVTALMKRLHEGGTLTAVAYDKPNTNKLAEGKVLTLDNQIDTSTGTIKLRALFDNSDGALFANQFVNIQLVQDTLHGQTIIPSAAVRRGAPNGVLSTFVYLVDAASSTVSVRPVTLGVVDGEREAVTQGLKPGDVIVTEGGDRLRDGAAVLLPEATPQHAMRPSAQPAGAQNTPGGGRRQRRQPAGSPSPSNPAPAQGTTGSH
ncbi:MAG: efflux RND transporter periplasmic adaptor subunit, partial [Sinobacteraceae bacterium]|nr:efflux RND transporter periplasmic adaptor subunit [Nevskiaceae bacterium]